jgi:hypothetical protein
MRIFFETATLQEFLGIESLMQNNIKSQRGSSIFLASRLVPSAKEGGGFTTPRTHSRTPPANDEGDNKGTNMTKTAEQVVKRMEYIKKCIAEFQQISTQSMRADKAAVDDGVPLPPDSPSDLWSPSHSSMYISEELAHNTVRSIHGLVVHTTGEYKPLATLTTHSDINYDVSTPAVKTPGNVSSPSPLLNVTALVNNSNNINSSITRKASPSPKLPLVKRRISSMELKENLMPLSDMDFLDDLINDQVNKLFPSPFNTKTINPKARSPYLSPKEFPLPPPSPNRKLSF